MSAAHVSQQATWYWHTASPDCHQSASRTIYPTITRYHFGADIFGASPSQEMWVTQGWQSDQNAWWIGPNHHPITHEQGGKNCQGRSVRCGEGNFWHVINAKEPAIIQVLPREMGSYIYFFLWQCLPSPTLDLWFCSAAEKAHGRIFFLSQILYIYAPQNLELTYTLHTHLH